MVELACDEAVFHFNKKHLEDSTVPMWVIKAKGNTYYVEHVDAQLLWSTKETPDNPHTKGSIKFKDCYVGIDDNNVCTIRELTEVDEARIKAKDKGHTRIVFKNRDMVEKYFKEHNLKFTPIKYVPGSCGSGFYICDIVRKQDATFALLAISGQIRALKENEQLWKAYDDEAVRRSLDADYIDLDELYEEDDDED